MMLINPFMVAPAIPASTKILMPFTTASGFTDVANGHAITVIGTPSISTVQSKFGAGALRLTTNNYLKIDATPTLNFSGNKVLTLEFWAYVTGFSGAGGILSTRSSGAYSNLVVNYQYTLVGNAALNNWTFINDVLPLNQWVHVAIVLDGVNIKEYVNGVQTGTIVAHPSWPSNNSFLNIGHDFAGGITGYINDLRISDVAVYTADFTPPTSPF